MNLNIKFQLVTVFFLALINGAFAQQLSLKIIQGSIEINKEVFETPMIVVPIWPNAEVKINEQSIVLASKGNSCAELKSGNYSYQTIENRIEKESSSFSAAFVNVIFSEKFQESNQQKSGVTTRGTTAKPANYYYPPDDFYLIDDSLKLEIGNSNTSLLNKVFVYNQTLNDTILVKKSKSIVLHQMSPGKYFWGYSVSYIQGLNKVKENYLNSFIVPDQSFIEKEKNAIEILKKSIKKFSPQSQHEILNAYFYENKLVGYEEN